MKIFNVCLCCILLTLSFYTHAQPQKAISTIGGRGKIIDDTDQKTAPADIKRGCGYSQPIVVAGMIGNPPFGWVEYDSNRERKPYESYGVGRDILEKITHKLGMSYISTGFHSFDEAILALKRGEIDLLLSTYYQPKRLGLGVDVIVPSYFQNVFTPYFKKGKEFPVSSLADLQGFKGVIRREEHLYSLIQSQLPQDMDIIQVSGAKKAFEMLLNGEADYLLGSPYSEEAELRRYKLNTEIVTNNVVLKNAGIAFALSTNSSCYRDLKKILEETLKEDEFSQEKISSIVLQKIDAWGERFRHEEGLIKKQEASPSEEEQMMPPSHPVE